MTLHIHALAGCTPQPLAHYLEALGVLRLVAEQADPAARGFWRDECFHLVTSLDRAALITFFAQRWMPTPMVTPWNGGSGFYPKDKAARSGGVEPLLASTHPRFAPYRRVLADCIDRVGDREERPVGEAKTSLQGACRAEWTGPALAWFSSAIVLGEDSASYPSLLGTGGNDGRLDFTSNFMQRLVELFHPDTGLPRDGTSGLENALFGTPFKGLQDNSVGQFLPGDAGGANATSGFEGKAQLNTWDFVLLLEGALMLSVAAVRYLDAGGLPQAAAPFAFRGSAAGYASASRADESARGEQWMPLWDRPATFAEIQDLFAQGRVLLGRRPARSARDAARAIASQAVARGISAFERFGYIERNGQSNLAVPLGRWHVAQREQATVLAEIEPWVDRLRSASKDPQRDPDSLQRQMHAIESAMLDIYRRGGHPAEWQRLLITLGQAEDGLVRRRRHTASKRLRPIPPLSPSWILLAAGDNPPVELRLAAALASQTGQIDGRWTPLRQHCLPLDPRGSRFLVQGEQLASPPSLVWTGRDLVDDLGVVLERRLIDSSRGGEIGLRLSGRATASLADVGAFLSGACDARRLAGLTRGLMAVRWPKDDELAQRARRALHVGGRRGGILPLFAVLRVAHGLHVIPDLGVEAVDVRDIVRLLRAGRLSQAVRVTTTRLRGRGLTPQLHHALGSPVQARFLAASMLFPLSRSDLRFLLDTSFRTNPAALGENQETP